MLFSEENVCKSKLTPIPYVTIFDVSRPVIQPGNSKFKFYYPPKR